MPMVSPLVSGAIDEAQNQVQSFLAAGSDSRCLQFVAHGAIECLQFTAGWSFLRVFVVARCWAIILPTLWFRQTLSPTASPCRPARLQRSSKAQVQWWRLFLGGTRLRLRASIISHSIHLQALHSDGSNPGMAMLRYGPWPNRAVPAIQARWIFGLGSGGSQTGHWDIVCFVINP